MIPTYIATKCFNLYDETNHICFELDGKWFALSHNYENTRRKVVPAKDNWFNNRKPSGKQQYIIAINKPVIIKDCEIQVKPKVKFHLKFNFLL